MGVGIVTVVMAGAESSSDFSSSIFGTAGTSDERSFRIFLQGKPKPQKTHQWPNLLHIMSILSGGATEAGPVWGSPRQDLSPLLRVCHTVHRLLRVLTLTHRGNLSPPQGRKSLTGDNITEQKWICTSRISTFRTCTVWTWGDWMTEGWAAWITPCTWTVWPLGNCTSVTVGLLDETCAAAMEACRAKSQKQNCPEAFCRYFSVVVYSLT